MKRFLTALLFSAAIAMPTVAMAESVDIAPISIQMPEKWTATSDVNDNRLAVFVDPETENRIEIYKRAATNASHAKVLFKAFFEQLKNNKIVAVDSPKEQRIALTNGAYLDGQYGEFSYEDSGVPIAVIVYAFTKDENAFIAVGYFVRANRADGIDLFNTMLKNISDIEAK